MVEMRREKRWPASLKLEIVSLYKQDVPPVEGIHEPIEITDVSKAGVGFKSKANLPVDYYFNAKLTLRKEEPLKCVIHILRQLQTADGYRYGCEIVGIASVMDYVVNNYAASLSEN